MIELISENKINLYVKIKYNDSNYKVVKIRKMIEWLGEPKGYLLTCEKINEL